MLYLLIYFVKKILFNIYLASIILIGLPPFILLNDQINSTLIAKLFLVVTTISIYFVSKKKIFKPFPFFILILLFFATQSLSLIHAQNVYSFVEKYQNLFFSMLFLISSYFLIENNRDIKKIITVLLFVTGANIIYQMFMVFFSIQFLNIASLIFHKGYLNLQTLNIERQRIYIDSYPESLLPLLSYLIFRQKRPAYSILLIPITILSFVSGFRTRFVMMIFGLLASIVLFSKSFIRYLWVILAIVLLLYFTNSIAKSVTGQTVIDRFTLENNIADLAPILGRFEKWNESIEIGFSSPLLGVGLGNYYDNIQPNEKLYFTIFYFSKSVERGELAAMDPHNIFMSIFAETGFAGLIAYMLLISYFIYFDYKIVTSRNDQSKAFVAGFWILFSYSLFNPSSTLPYLSSFWLFRILITKSFYSMPLTVKSRKL